MSVHTFLTDISASTGRNDFIFDIWLWHGDLYCVSPFQVYCTSASCLQCNLEFFIFAVMKTFVTVISASTGRNDFIFDIYMALTWWLAPCLPFPGFPHIYFLFTVRLTNERVGVFLARRSVQHLVFLYFPFFSPLPIFSCIRAKIPVFSYIPVQKRMDIENSESCGLSSWYWLFVSVMGDMKNNKV